MKKRLLWLGGTGRTGYLVIEKALVAGWAVNMLAREPARISANSPDVTVVKGSPEQVEDLDAAMAGWSGRNYRLIWLT